MAEQANEIVRRARSAKVPATSSSPSADQQIHEDELPGEEDEEGNDSGDAPTPKEISTDAGPRDPEAEANGGDTASDSERDPDVSQMSQARRASLRKKHSIASRMVIAKHQSKSKKNKQAQADADDSDDDLLLVPKKKKIKAKPPIQHDDDDTAIFAPRKPALQGDISAATHQSAVTPILFPSLLFRLGPPLCNVLHNGFKVKMIKYIERKFSLSFEWGSTDVAGRLKRLNNSYQHHLQKFRLNIAMCVERLLLEPRSAEDPMLAWVLVR
jgi:hypothetical protein